MAIVNNRLSTLDYEKRFAEIHPPLTKGASAVEANRCLYCFDAPCIKACPTSIDIPLFIKQIATDNIKGAATTILDANIMGSSCARVCPTEKLCEGNCVLNAHQENPIEIGLLQRYATDPILENDIQLFDRAPSTGKKVAVVGAGPAGLSCAHQLSRAGVDVTIYEKEDRAGGLMTYGIAAYKVADDFCDKETDWILSLGGIDVKYNQSLGKEIQLSDLQTNYDAVFLGIGVGNTRKLGVTGEDAAGVYDAIDFIYDIRTKSYDNIAVGDDVTIIGMGMTAIDAATQAKRLGAKNVRMIYRRTEAEKGCTDVELNIAKLDGCMIQWLANPKEIVATDGHISSLVCDVMKLGEADDSGRRSPKPTGETMTFKTDMLIKAIGQIPYSQLVDTSGLDNSWGKMTVAAGGETNMSKVFAGGDCVNGGKEVVDAVQDGKDAAQTILNHLGLKRSGIK